MNFAIIGTNFVTDWMLEAGQLCPEFTLSAVCSRNLERAKEYAGKHGAKYIFDNIDALCHCEEVDAIYVASPTVCHCEQTLQLMEAGKHILCEKPIASNSTELNAMLNCSKKNNVVLLEAMRPEFNPTLKIIENTIKSLGKIRRVSITFSKYSSRYDKFLSGELVNTFNPKLSNGALTDLGCYCILVLLRLFGKPLKIQSSAVKLANGLDAAGAFLADYDGMIADISYSKVSDTYNFCEIQGERGTLQFRDPSSLKEIYLIMRGKAPERIVSSSIEQDMFYELQAFIDYVKNPERAEVHQRNSIEMMQIMDEVRRQCNIVFPADVKSNFFVD